jgi:hypothetical protein
MASVPAQASMGKTIKAKVQMIRSCPNMIFVFSHNNGLVIVVRLHIRKIKNKIFPFLLVLGKMSELPEQASRGQKQNPIIKAQVLMIRYSLTVSSSLSLLRPRGVTFAKPLIRSESVCIQS